MSGGKSESKHGKGNGRKQLAQQSNFVLDKPADYGSLTGL